MTTHGIVAAILPAHITGGVLALAFGYVALAAAKGGRLHRRSGVLFVGAMVLMALSGAFVDALRTATVSVNVVAGLVTFYLVTTALLTVRARTEWSLPLDRAAALLAGAIGVMALYAGVRLAGTGRPETAPCFIFGIVALLAARGDVQMIRAGGAVGARRIRRHLWRMCFAMWIAAASFFWGPQNRVPEIIRIPALQAFAVLLPIIAMRYWLWRTRKRRSWTGIPVTVLERP